MTSTGAVSVVASGNVDADQKILTELFGYEVEEQTETRVLLHENHSLILFPASEEKGRSGFSMLVFTEAVLKSIRAENSEMIRNAEWQSYFLGPKAVIMVKFKLPGGHTIVACSPDGWKDATARAKAVQFSLAKYNSQEQQETENIVQNLPFAERNLIPSLESKYLSRGGQLVPFQLNCQSEVPVETDLFVGKMMFLVRPTEPKDDPYWNERIFSKKKRRFIILLQGKLKYEPQGPLYAGLEVSDPMKLGLMTSGICSLILKFIKNYEPNLHYSFGDEEENAHMSVLAEHFFHGLVVTPPGEQLPDLEDQLSSSRDFSSPEKEIKWNTKDTYTMMYHTMYIDLPSWTTSHIPLVRDIRLQTFWGNSLLKVVLYEPNKNTSTHVATDNKYLMSIQVKYLEPHERKSVEETSGEDDYMSTNSASSMSSWGDMGLVGESSAGDAGMSQSYADLGSSIDETSASEGQEGGDEFFDTHQTTAKPATPDIPPELTDSSPHSLVLKTLNEFCPFVIERAMPKLSYESIYVFRGKTGPVLRSLESATTAFGQVKPSIRTKDWFSPRLNEEEQTRRSLCLKYITALREDPSQPKIALFRACSSQHDRMFLRERFSKFEKKSRHFFAVARAVGDHHWVEERALVTAHTIDFYRVDKKKPGFQIGLSNITKVGKMTAPLLEGFHCLSVETFGRTTYLMFENEEERSTWGSVIRRKAKAKNGLPQNTSLTNHLINVDDPVREFLHKSAMFEYNKKKILNCRRFSFHVPKPQTKQDTLALAEEALRKATALQAKGPNDADLMDFLNCAAALKTADAYDLTEEERVAFFLNLYHVMIMHAFIVLGPPKSGLDWLTYFNNFAYQCSDDIFSLTELEHNIIRAEMSYPSQFLSRFVLPKSKFHFALTRPDFRINCALNSGSLSMPSSAVPIYKPDFLDDQLTEAVEKFVSVTVILNRKKDDVSVTLPRLCQWFANDFGDGSASDTLKKLKPFMTREQRDTLRSMWNPQKKSYDIKNVKFLPFIFECRFLTLEAFQPYTI
eukprot:scaffold1729_cov117-Cylindrotheca_fusiformis.AAC.3